VVDGLGVIMVLDADNLVLRHLVKTGNNYIVSTFEYINENGYNDTLRTKRTSATSVTKTLSLRNNWDLIVLDNERSSMFLITNTGLA
jgi:uncharacterized protein YccT (UPF0319 family)